MRRNHGKVVTGRDMSFWAITTDQITERALEAKDKVNNAKGTNLTAGPLLKES